MKTPLLTLVSTSLSLCLSGAALGAEGNSRLVMPGDIKPEVLMADERNPFERRIELKSEDDIVSGAELSEEDRVRQKFNVLQVCGGSAGVRVLLSDMILEKGKPVAPVLPDQTINLIVTDISTDEVVLTWADDVGKKRPRTIVIPYDLSPRVGFLLSGQTDLAEDAQRVMTDRIMRPAERPHVPALRAVDKDGNEVDLEAAGIVGQ